MHVISGCIVQTYLYPWFQPWMLCSKLLPACHEKLKGRNCTREDGGGLTRQELLYMVERWGTERSPQVRGTKPEGHCEARQDQEGCRSPLQMGMSIYGKTLQDPWHQRRAKGPTPYSPPPNGDICVINPKTSY